MSLIETTSPYVEGTLTIDIPFEWIDEADLFVARVGEGTALPRPAASASDTTWRFINRQRIQIVNPVVGEAYRVERKTSTEKVFAEFVPGTPIRSQDLNSNFKQTLHVVQENTGERWSRSGDTMRGNISMSTYDANGAVIEGPYKITGLGSPSSATDAANKQFVETTANDILLQQGVAFEVLERYLGPVATLPEYRKTGDDAVNAADVPDFGTLAFHQNKMWMLVTPTDTINYHARWNEVIVAQVNPISTYKTTVYPDGSGSLPQLDSGLNNASDADLVAAYIFNGDLFSNQSLAIPTNYNILQVNGKTLKPWLSTFNPGDYKVNTEANEFYIKKSVLDSDPFGPTKELEITLIAFSDADVAPHGWSSAEWNYNSTSEKWELTLIGDKDELDITMDNLVPEFAPGTISTVQNTSDNEPGDPTFNIRKVDTGNVGDNHYEVDIGIPLGKDGAQINGVTFDLQGKPTFQLSNGLTFEGNTSLKGPQGSIGNYVGDTAFAYKAAPFSPSGFQHNIIEDGSPIQGAGRLPNNYLELILDWNSNPQNETNQVGFADVYQLVGRYFLYGELEDGTQGYINSFFDITNPDYLVGPAPALSIGSVSTAPAGSSATAEFVEDLETGDGYKLNLQLEAPRISFDGHAVTSFAEGTEGETESATFTYSPQTRLHTMSLNIEKAGPPTFATGSINVTSDWVNDASVTFNDAGGDLTADYTINVDLPLTDIRIDSGASTYNGNTYTDGVRLTGSLSDDTPGAFNVYLEKQTKGMLDSNLAETVQGTDPTAVYKMYMDVPVFPAPQIEIDTTVVEGDTPNAQRGYLVDGNWTLGTNPADLTDYNLRFTLPTKVKSGNGNPNGQTAQQDKWNVQVVSGLSAPAEGFPYGLYITINGIASGWGPLTADHRTQIIDGNWTNWLNDTRDFFNSAAVKTDIFGDIYSNVTVNTTTKTFTFTSTANEPFNAFTAQMYLYSYQSVNAPERTQYGREALDPVSGVQDQTYYDFHNNKVYQHDGTNWVEQSGFGESIESLHWGADGQLHITHQDPAKSVSTGDLRGPGYLSGSYNSSDGKVTFTANGFHGTTDVTTGDLRAPGFTGGSYDPETGVVTFTSNGGQGASDVVTGDLRGQFFPQGEVTELPTNLGPNDIGKNYLLTQSYSDKVLGHTYYWTGSAWQDLGYTRGIQGVSVNNVDLDDSTGTSKLTIGLDDGSTPIDSVDITPPRIIVSNSAIVTWPSVDATSAAGTDVVSSDIFDGLRVGDSLLVTQQIKTAADELVADKGEILIKNGNNLERSGSLQGPAGNDAPFGGVLYFEGEGNTFKPYDGAKHTYYIAQDTEYVLVHYESGDLTPYDNWGVYTNTYLAASEFEPSDWKYAPDYTNGAGFAVKHLKITDEVDYIVIGPAGVSWEVAYNNAVANLPNSSAGTNGYHYIRVFKNAHDILTNITAGRFGAEGDVTITEDPNTGRVTVNNTNKVTVEQPVVGNFTGSHALDKSYTGNLLNFKSTDAGSSIILRDLTADDVGVTFVINNTGSEKTKVQGNGTSNVVLAGSSATVSTIDIAPNGMLHATYLHDAYTTSGRTWVILGQGLTGNI